MDRGLLERVSPGNPLPQAINGCHGGDGYACPSFGDGASLFKLAVSRRPCHKTTNRPQSWSSSRLTSTLRVGTSFRNSRGCHLQRPGVPGTGRGLKSGFLDAVLWVSADRFRSITCRCNYQRTISELCFRNFGPIHGTFIVEWIEPSLEICHLII